MSLLSIIETIIKTYKYINLRASITKMYHNLHRISRIKRAPKHQLTEHYTHWITGLHLAHPRTHKSRHKSRQIQSCNCKCNYKQAHLHGTPHINTSIRLVINQRSILFDLVEIENQWKMAAQVHIVIPRNMVINKPMLPITFRSQV